jgi:hypothetical protein
VSAKPLLADPSLLQFEVAGDPELMREIFQRHLQSLGEKAYQVRECRLFRTIYRRAVCHRQYALRLAESGTGRERIQQVTVTMYAGG